MCFYLEVVRMLICVSKSNVISLLDSVGDLSASSSSDILSASLSAISKKQFIMMPPEEKLALVDRRAQDHQDKQEVGDLQGSSSLISDVLWADYCKLHKYSFWKGQPHIILHII